MSTAYLLYGKSGSGKGTQAQLLKEHLESLGKKVIYIETGKLFRAFSEAHNDFMGDHVRSVIDAGKLMPAFFPIYLWSKELVENYTGTEDIILDGVGRRVEEASVVDSAFGFLEIKNKYIIHIDVSDEWVINHMGNRTRADDTAEGMQKRLAWFTANVIPVIDYFKSDNSYVVQRINGEQSIQEVAIEIQQNISN